MPDNQGFHGPHIPDVIEQVEEEEEMDSEDVSDEEELDESSEDEKEEESPPSETKLNEMHVQKPTNPMLCRTIRIGSFKIFPLKNEPYLPVNLSVDAISFRCPISNEATKYVDISLKSQDITRILVHFGEPLPLMFIFTTPSFAESIKNILPSDSEGCYFDPTSSNDKIQKITFIINSVTVEHRNFIRHCFPGDKKVKEIDQAKANVILVKSTPFPNYSAGQLPQVLHFQEDFEDHINQE